MATARYYRPDKNAEGASFPGVPLRDLEEEEFEALPAWVKASVDASDLYQKTPMRKAKSGQDDAGKQEET